MRQSLIVSFIATTVAASVLIPLVLKWLKTRGVVDVPVDRSLHTRPTPRGGGIALTAAMAIGLGVAGSVPWPVWVGILGFAFIGAYDDLQSQTATTRLVGQGLLAAIVAVGLTQSSGAQPWTWFGVALIIAASVNATNFMDGINGITALHAVIWGITYAVALPIVGLGDLIPLAITLSAASIVFLPWNFPRARLFLGDSGSYLIGASVGILASAGVLAGYLIAFLGPLSIYAVDTGLTLARRVTRREPLTEAHRSHIFQRLVALGWSHQKTTLVTAGLSTACALLALATLSIPAHLTTVSLLCILLLCALYVLLPAQVRSRKRRQD